MALYQVLYWQEIPSSVKAWDDFDEVKLDLGPRLADKIDRAAQARGLTKSEDYLGQWKWSEEQERDGAPDEVAQALKAELDANFP